MPSAWKLIQLGGRLTYGPWFFARHVATAGDDSITHAPVGKKLMLIAKHGNPFRNLETVSTSVKFSFDYLRKPPLKQMQRSLRFYMSQPTSSMIQPACGCILSSHFGVALR